MSDNLHVKPNRRHLKRLARVGDVPPIEGNQSRWRGNQRNRDDERQRDSKTPNFHFSPLHSDSIDSNLTYL